MRDLHTVILPDRIINVTNGIAFRRWLHEANPRLTRLLASAVGPAVLDDEEKLTDLRGMADDVSLQKRFAACRYMNKLALAEVIRRELEIRVDPAALFDVQIKRIHEYKRQLLNILEVIALYNAIRARPMDDWTPRVKIFGGKAAASYHQAKLIIKLIHDVARVINSDPTVRDTLKIVFLPNYSVSLAEIIIPAADLSEQISTAGMEASGTGNMKFALNGALTIGTLDGANIELLERVGDDNMFIFGLTAEQVADHRQRGIDAGEIIAQVADAGVRGVVERRVRRLLARPAGPLRRPGECPAPSRLLHGLRGLRRLLRHATPHRGVVAARPRGMVAGSDPEHGECRLVLLRPLDPGIRQQRLERAELLPRVRAGPGAMLRWQRPFLPFAAKAITPRPPGAAVSRRTGVVARRSTTGPRPAVLRRPRCSRTVTTPMRDCRVLTPPRAMLHLSRRGPMSYQD